MERTKIGLSCTIKSQVTFFLFQSQKSNENRGTYNGTRNEHSQPPRVPHPRSVEHPIRNCNKEAGEVLEMSLLRTGLTVQK